LYQIILLATSKLVASLENTEIGFVKPTIIQKNLVAALENICSRKIGWVYQINLVVDIKDLAITLNNLVAVQN
jgi:hypothetical protein